MRGLACDAITHDAEAWEWVFGFGTGVSLRVAAPWRIVANGAIALGHEDDGQRFGLPRPVDGAARALDLLRSRLVTVFDVADVTADARVEFGDGILLDVFNSSSGYEGWTLSDGTGRLLVAQGGGRLVEVRP